MIESIIITIILILINALLGSVIYEKIDVSNDFYSIVEHDNTCIMLILVTNIWPILTPIMMIHYRKKNK